MRGERKRDYPASVFYQLPWFKEAYKPFAEFICKTGTVLDEGREEAPILLIEPLQTAYIKQNPKNAKKINELQSNFENITNELSGSHMLYHYGERKTIFAGRRFTLTEMPKTVDISKITESGFWFFSGAMELTGNIAVSKKENTKYVLSLKKLNAPAAGRNLQCRSVYIYR